MDSSQREEAKQMGAAFRALMDSHRAMSREELRADVAHSTPIVQEVINQDPLLRDLLSVLDSMGRTGVANAMAFGYIAGMRAERERIEKELTARHG